MTDSTCAFNLHPKLFADNFIWQASCTCLLLDVVTLNVKMLFSLLLVFEPQASCTCLLLVVVTLKVNFSLRAGGVSAKQISSPSGDTATFHSVMTRLYRLESFCLFLSHHAAHFGNRKTWPHPHPKHAVTSPDAGVGLVLCFELWGGLHTKRLHATQQAIADSFLTFSRPLYQVYNSTSSLGSIHHTQHWYRLASQTGSSTLWEYMVHQLHGGPHILSGLQAGHSAYTVHHLNAHVHKLPFWGHSLWLQFKDALWWITEPRCKHI